MKKVLFLFVLVLSFSLKAQLTALITYEGESCQFSNDARILVDASGGDGNYVYAVSVSGGAIPDESSFTSNNILQNFTAGDYEVYVRDNNGDVGYEEYTNVINIEPALGIDVAAYVESEMCSDGLVNIVVQVFGELPLIAIDMMKMNEAGFYEFVDADHTVNSNGDFVYSDVEPGTYEIRAHSNSCRAGFDLTVEERPKGVEFLVVNNLLASCSEGGSLGVEISSGVSPYTINVASFDDPSVPIIAPINTSSNVLNINDLPPDTYSISITDANGCSDIHNITIEEADELQLSISTRNVTCDDDANNGSIFVETIGDVGNYNYELINLSTGDSLVQSSNFFDDLASGDYVVYVTGLYYCIVQSSPINIANPEPFFITTTELSTGNIPSGSITVDVSGGNPPYDFGIDGIDGVFSSSNVFTGLSEGDYTVEVIDSNGCIFNSLTTITKVDVDNSISVDPTLGLVATYKDALSYQWINLDTGERISGATNVNYLPIVDGNYQVEMVIDTSTIIVSPKGLNNKKSKELDNQTILSPIISFSMSTLSVKDIVDTSFNIYPNPTSDFINLPASLINTNYSIYSVTGSEVQKGKINDVKIDIKSLAKGLYFFNTPDYDRVKFIKE